ncbi:hypothetical protein D3C78_1265220 [compost metagenome]
MIIIKVRIIPKKPNVAALIMRRKRNNLADTAIEKTGVARLDIAVSETTITIAVDTKPACTAACPMTSAPTMDTADPIAFGIRTPASRRISKITSINSASTNAVNGVASSCETSEITNCVGIIS